MGTSKSGNWSKLTSIDRFMEKVLMSDNGCWEWQRQLNNKGYGIFWDNSKCQLAHRWIYSYYKQKEIDRKIYICHRCDNPKCVNPDHLFEGTALDNTKDMMDKKRLRGGRNYCHGLPILK